MPAFTITAVDTTNNKLTATGVAAIGGAPGAVLATGDRLRLRNVGGALPAATPALAGAVDLFAIRVDDDSIKVAVTNSDALAGTAIDITGSGTGTTTIEFNLPYCVPRVALPGGVMQVFSQDDNAQWNALVALYCLLTGQAQGVWSSVALIVPFLSAVKAPDFLFTNQQTLYFSAADAGTPSANAPALSVDHATGAVVWTFTATTQRIAVPLSRLRTGDRIISFGARANTTPSIQLTIKLWFNDPALASGTGNATQVGSTLTHANTVGDATSTLGTPHTVAAGESFHMTAGGTASGAPVFLFDVFVTIDRPV